MSTLPTPDPCDTSEWYKDPGDRDSVLVYGEEGEKSYYKKGYLKQVLKWYPELKDSEYVDGPDETYAKAGLAGTKPCDIDLIGCEVCIDGYYRLYAYLLKQHNGEKKYSRERQTLIELYRNINSIFGKLKGGGTFFGHQHVRILGYAEYSIYLLSRDQNKDYYFREYNISAQKKLYIASLRQLINDEIDNNQQVDNEYKLSLKKQLLETVREIDSLISSYYYLKMTQDFQHSNY